MRWRWPLRGLLLTAVPLAGLAWAGWWPVGAKQVASAPTADFASEGDGLRQELRAARQAAAQARARAERLAAQAAGATAAEDRARGRLAGLAARLQEAEAQANLGEARLAVIDQQRRRIDRNLAARREPLVRLTAALQRLAAQPMALSALQPASMRDAVYLRAVLGHAVPVVQARTRELRAELEQSRRLAGQARLELGELRRTEDAIAAQRSALLAETARQRQVFVQAAGAARREASRAEEIALEARDLDDLVEGFDRMARQRALLVSLPGPVIRPVGSAATVQEQPVPATPLPVTTGAPAFLRQYRLPVVGRIVGGFGDADASGAARTGLSLAPRPAALVVAPGAGRVAFAGPYRGFGSIVIIEHVGGWASLVTGLGALDVAVGQEVDAGDPLGSAPGRRPTITLELRRDGELVDPLPYALAARG